MLTIIGVLATMHIAQLVAYFSIGDADVFDFVLALDFDVEGNLPSMYSSLAIMFCVVLLAAIAGASSDARAPWRHHWLGLAWIFAFLAFDEASAVHERIGNFVGTHIDATGVLFFPWVIPYGIALCVFVIIYARFLVNLPTQTAVRFAIAGALFTSGALGLELLGAREAETFGTEALRYNVLSTLEELCEMRAVVIFAHALLRYRAAEIGPV